MQSVLEDVIDEFKKTIKDNNKLKSIKDKETIKMAVDLAYNDAKRTMTGIGNYRDEKDATLNEIVEELHSYFNDDSIPMNNKDFDKKHKALCNLWYKKFVKTDIGTYGKAQKIVNMAFKYLYCCPDAKENEDYFKYCHVTLDSFTLEWFVREVRSTKKIVKKYVSTWSSIEKYNDNAEVKNETYSYMFYQNEFRNLKSKNEALSDLTPFQKEFIMWPYYKNKLAAESFLIGLLDQPDNNVKNKIKRNSIFNNYEEIKNQINKVEKSKLVQIFKNAI